MSRYKKLCNGQKDRINTVLEHFKKISNFYVFLYTNICKMQIWANFVPTCEYKTVM